MFLVRGNQFREGLKDGRTDGQSDDYICSPEILRGA